MHHGKSLNDAMQQESLLQQFGATNKYPEGKLNETDEGEIQLGVTHDPKIGKVIINFGKPVAWIGFSGAQAMDLARSLEDHACRCRDVGQKREDQMKADQHRKG